MRLPTSASAYGSTRYSLNGSGVGHTLQQHTATTHYNNTLHRTGGTTIESTRQVAGTHIFTGRVNSPHCNTHCNALQRTTTHCNALQRTDNALQRTAIHCDALQRTATHCNALQCTATHCNALQRTATHCNTLQRTATTHCNALTRAHARHVFEGFVFVFPRAQHVRVQDERLASEIDNFSKVKSTVI